ncbi:hypothetical protein Vafri_13264, partial [Volvox africanus]
FVDGSLAGSVSRPQASILMRVEDGAIGGALLGRAQALLEVDSQQRLHVDVDVMPRSPKGATATAAAATSGVGQASGADITPQQQQGHGPTGHSATGNGETGGYVRLVGTAKLPAAMSAERGKGKGKDQGFGAAAATVTVSEVRRWRAPVKVRARTKRTGKVTTNGQLSMMEDAVAAGVQGIGDGGNGNGVAGSTEARLARDGEDEMAVAEMEAEAEAEAAAGTGGDGAASTPSNDSGSSNSSGEGAEGLVSERDEVPPPPPSPPPLATLLSSPPSSSPAAGAEEEIIISTSQEHQSLYPDHGQDQQQQLVELDGQQKPRRQQQQQQQQGRQSDLDEGQVSEQARECGKGHENMSKDQRPVARVLNSTAPPKAQVATETTDITDRAIDSSDGPELSEEPDDVEEEEEEYGREWVRHAESEGGRHTNVEEEEEEEVTAELHVRDGGMGLLVALIPECEWQGGGAAVDLRVHGSLKAPQVEGRARVTRGSLLSPVLRYPVTNLNADIQFDGHTLIANSVEAGLGKTGSFRVRGALPVQPPVHHHHHHDHHHHASHHQQHQQQRVGFGAGGDGLVVEVDGAEVRARGLYSGVVDGRLTVRRSLAQPLLGGRLRFSKGVAYLLPQQGPGPGSTTSTAAAASPASDRPETSFGGPLSSSDPRVEGPEVVRASFSLLKAGRKRALLAAGGRHGVTAGGALAVEMDASATSPGAGGSGGADGSPPPGPALMLSGLELVLGPDLRALFPVVLNLGLSGSVTLNGPADPKRLQPSGTVHLDSGTLNLVATQFILDREHDNRIIFAQQDPPQLSQPTQPSQPQPSL